MCSCPSNEKWLFVIFFALCLFQLFLFIAATVRTDLLHPVTAYYSKRRVKAPIFNQRTTFQHRKGSKMDTMPKKTPGHFPVPLPYTSFAIKTTQNPSVVVVVAASLRTRNGKVGRKSCLSSLLFTLARFFFPTHRLFQTCPNLFCAAAHLRSLDRVFLLGLFLLAQ